MGVVGDHAPRQATGMGYALRRELPPAHAGSSRRAGIAPDPDGLDPPTVQRAGTVVGRAAMYSIKVNGAPVLILWAAMLEIATATGKRPDLRFKAATGFRRRIRSSAKNIRSLHKTRVVTVVDDRHCARRVRPIISFLACR